MRSLLMSCVLLGAILFSCGNNNEDDMYQRRIEWNSPFANQRVKNKTHHRGGVGYPCRDSNDCKVRMCCRLRHGSRTCRRLSYPGEQCSNEQTKGGAYIDRCPCVYGVGQCRNSYCNKNSWWWT
uniref:Ixodegrin B n=1 Tax=Rhipicephalus appendiculatus TaxID=34631 RepID=A0A131YSI4_RHIAP